MRQVFIMANLRRFPPNRSSGYTERGSVTRSSLPFLKAHLSAFPPNCSHERCGSQTRAPRYRTHDFDSSSIGAVRTAPLTFLLPVPPIIESWVIGASLVLGHW